jgi:cytoskeletal protein CcmA (bactofilin family)
MAAGDPGVLKRNFSATAIETTLVNSISSAATGDTTTSVSVVSVSGFPTVPYTLILGPDTNKEEVVTVTAASSTTLTITRGQDGTQAQAHTAGTSVRHGVSGRDFKEEQTHIAARGYDADSGILANASQTHVHGLVAGDGSVVGADQLVTLTRKTLTTPTINGATLTGTVSSTASIVVSGAGTITGLSSAGMVASSATPKNYVDAILGSATAASTSATSAATSATSAATSATSAANSATASASSASAAATSASSALTSQTAAATSATSAAASATAAATSATSAAASATAAGTSATSAAASATTAAASVATISASATAAASSATAAATSATSAAASATAAATLATSAAASATTASNSAATATTQAGNASASATAAATSATSASASATAAATSATSAATSASSALTSQTAAATSAASAATSATSAATTYDDFDDRYLGSKSTAPTVDNDGNTLLVGAIYWNSTLNNMYVWSGSVWVQIATTNTYSAPTLGSTTIGSGATVTNVNGLTINSTTIPTSATLTKTSDKLSVFAATTSAELAGVISDETGSGSLVFANTPTIATPTLTGTVTASGDINLSATNGPGSLIDELTLYLMGAL